MSTYLIDFENVKSGGLAGIEHIRKEDSVHLFWSARENKITIEMMELIRSSESEIVMHKAVTGERDALDHQLCSYLGFLAGGRGENDFVIVSNDKAYDHLIEFWRKLNDQIRIQRVSEISRVSETVHAAETAAETAEQVSSDTPKAEPVRAEKTDKTDRADKIDKGQNDHAEAAERVMPDTFGGRNSRRRERGSRYLKGGRTGRGSRKSNYAENYADERWEEEKTADTVRESGGYQAEAPAPAEPKKDSAAAYVVTGIRTGILVESGFTADGILNKRDEAPAAPERKNAVEKTAENTAENAVKKVPENKAEKAMEQTAETADVKAAEEAVLESSEMKSDILSEMPEKKADSVPFEQPLEPMSEKSGETPERKTTSSETNSEKPAEAAEKPAETAERPEETVEKPAETAERPEETVEKSAETAEKPEETAENTKEITKAPAAAEAVKEEAEEKQSSDNGRKTRSRSSRTTTRAKRERPAKKEHSEYFPEIRVPVIESDVIAKCEEAANADWTGEVVRLINQSKDKKELYSAIVRLLGQEKGRTVYHAIKVLK